MLMMASRQLRAGKTVKVRPRGNSMTGRIASGQLVTLEPCTDAEVGDVVLCKVNGRLLLHLIRAKQGNRYQIANNSGHINGWCGANQLYGKVISVED